MFGLVLLSASISTGELVTLKYQANKNPPLANSPHPVSLSTSSGNFSTSQKSHTAPQHPYLDIWITFFLYLGPFKPIHKKETIIVLQGYLSPFIIITSMLQGMLQLINVLTRLCETTLHAMKNGQGCCYLSTVTA